MRRALASAIPWPLAAPLFFVRSAGLGRLWTYIAPRRQEPSCQRLRLLMALGPTWGEMPQAATAGPQPEPGPLRPACFKLAATFPVLLQARPGRLSRAFGPQVACDFNLKFQLTSRPKPHSDLGPAMAAAGRTRIELRHIPRVRDQESESP